MVVIPFPLCLDGIVKQRREELRPFPSACRMLQWFFLYVLVLSVFVGFVELTCFPDKHILLKVVVEN